jgi:hypothetical protein
MSGKLFSNEEVSLIQNNYLNIPIKQLMYLLPGRTEGSIRAKANSIGEKKQYSTRKLSTDEKVWLQQNYHNASNKDLIKQIPGLTIKQIRKKARGLGLKRETREDFTQDEIDIIKKNYYNMTAKELALLLPGRSPDTITNKANSLGLKKRKCPKKWSQEEINWLIEFYVDSTSDELKKRFPEDDMKVIVTKAHSLGLSRKVDNTLGYTLIDAKMIQTKKCASCRRILPTSEFNKSKRNNSSLSSYCNSCKYEQEKKRREGFDEKKKAFYRLKGKQLKAESRRRNPEKSKEIQRRSYQLHRAKRTEYMRKKYHENPNYFSESNKLYRKNHPDQIKAKGLNRRAHENALPFTLTAEDILSLHNKNGVKECALTGLTGVINVCHFIPLKWGHGGSYKGNIFLGLEKLNLEMRTRNPFEWFNDKANAKKLDMDKINALISRLASENNLSINEFREFIYWCEQHKRTLEEVRLDPRPSINIWREQRSLPDYNVIISHWH